MKNNFLIIGSNSFSGAYFIKYLLEKGHDVIGISRSEEPNKVFLPYKWSNKLANNFEFVQLNNFCIQYKNNQMLNKLE